MGICHLETLELLDDTLEKLNIKYNNSKMFELGNQRAWPSLNLTCIKKRWKNGRNGAKILDLSYRGLRQHPDGDQLKILGGPFNIITNFGTSEHVEGQYWCFRNIHEFCEVGGIIYHKVPRVGSWKNHCPYYYDTEFFEKLASLSGYEIVVNKVWNHDDQTPQRAREECVCIYKKVKDTPFITEEEFNSLPITKV